MHAMAYTAGAYWALLITMARVLLTPKEAASAMGVSINHVRRLIEEADSMGKRARWRHGKEIIDLSPINSVRRTLRISVSAVLPGE